MRLRNATAGSDAQPVFKGSCTAAEVVGRAVYISGPESGGVFPVRLARCDDWSTMPAVGIIIEKPTTTTCYVQQVGRLPSGTVSGLERGKTYKVGYSGLLVKLAPAPGIGGFSIVQFIGLAMDSDEFHVSPDYQLKVNR